MQKKSWKVWLAWVFLLTGCGGAARAPQPQSTNLSTPPVEAPPQKVEPADMGPHLSLTLDDAKEFCGGTGTRVDPAKICNESQLNALRKYAHKQLYFQLAKDLNLNGKVFRAIPLLAGEFDGSGHTIENFSVGAGEDLVPPIGSPLRKDRTLRNGVYLGLFSEIANSGKVRRLKIRKWFGVHYDDIERGLIPAADRSTPLDCESHVMASGALAGKSLGTIEDVSVLDASAVMAKDWTRGGRDMALLVGNAGGLIRRCQVEGTLAADTHSGLLVGHFSGGDILESSAKGRLLVRAYGGGGLVGVVGSSYDRPTSIQQSKFVGTVSGVSQLGGIAGWAHLARPLVFFANDAEVTFESRAKVESSQLGGLVGEVSCGPSIRDPKFTVEKNTIRVRELSGDGSAIRFGILFGEFDTEFLKHKVTIRGGSYAGPKNWNALSSLIAEKGQVEFLETPRVD